jgi:hypothetical protein
LHKFAIDTYAAALDAQEVLIVSLDHCRQFSSQLVEHRGHVGVDLFRSRHLPYSSD